MQNTEYFVQVLFGRDAGEPFFAKKVPPQTLHKFYQLLDSLPKNLDRGEVEAFIGRMDVAHIGTDGDNVKTRELGSDDATLKTCVDHIHDGILAGCLAVGARVKVTQAHIIKRDTRHPYL